MRGLSDSKVELHDLADYFSRFDLVLLTEIAVESVPGGLFDGFSVAAIPAERTGRAGQGLLLAVGNDSRYHVEDHTSDSTALWVRLCPTASQAPILVGVCYLPPAGSPQLQHHSFPHRLDSLASTLLASPGMPVILAGDFNAHVGAAMDSRGRALQRMCTATSLQICTGQIAGDEAALPTLAATRRTQPTRPDHILANAAARTMLSSVVVSQHQRGLRPLAFGGAADSGLAPPAPAFLQWTAHSLQTLAVPGQIYILRLARQPASPRQCCEERCPPHHQSAAQPCHGSS